MIKPNFATAWAAAIDIYDPADAAERVAMVIGGQVDRNIHSSDPALRWVNTCAVRMSYILNKSGALVPKITDQTVSGADGHQYFYRVKDLINYLKKEWGQPAIVKYPQPGGGTLAGKKGVILFEVSGWSNAQGHATLFNGSTCYDHCYFYEPSASYRTEQANFWSLS